VSVQSADIDVALDNVSVEGRFSAAKYAVVRGFLSPDVCRLFARYVLLKAETGQMEEPDPRIPDAPRLYGDAFSETLLLEKAPLIEKVVGCALWPSYSYVRLHAHGASMPAHQDRSPSEIGTSINISSDRPWPLWFRVGDRDVPVTLGIGDAVVYAGRELPHWRESFEGREQVQCMLFYVRKDGECAVHRFDGREAIGLPRAPGLRL
jgi:hypothetical protein